MCNLFQCIQVSGDEPDDDPERLWCICQKPHNNRFMICCDKCEDWFHGSCVGVTRAMGELDTSTIDEMHPNMKTTLILII